MSSALQYAGHVLYVDFKQMGFEVMEKAKPVHQIEVVVLDSAATYQSGKLIVKCCMKCLRGQFWRRYPIKNSTLPRLVVPDIRQYRYLQAWKRGYDCWSQWQDFTDFDQCILIPKESTWDSVNKKETCSL